MGAVPVPTVVPKKSVLYWEATVPGTQKKLAKLAYRVPVAGKPVLRIRTTLRPIRIRLLTSMRTGNGCESTQLPAFHTDPALHFDADPDPNPDPAFYMMRIRMYVT